MAIQCIWLINNNKYSIENNDSTYFPQCREIKKVENQSILIDHTALLN